MIENDSVYLGDEGVTRDGTVVPQDKTYQRISGDGQISTHKAANVGSKAVVGAKRLKSAAGAPGTKIVLNDWSFASATEHLSGDSARFATIPGPASLLSLGAPYGYGWYRLKFKSGSVKKHHVIVPGGGDRLHMVLDGQHQGVMGHGPGATEETVMQLKKGAHTLVVLAENFGRAAGGVALATQPGLTGHAWSVLPAKTEKPKIVSGDPVDIMAFRAPLWHVHRGDTTDSRRLTWALGHRRKTPLFMRIAPIAASSLVLLNDEVIAYVERGTGAMVSIDPEKISRGNNTVQVAVHGSTEEHAAELQAGVHFHEGDENLTAKAEWAFARWEPPAPDVYIRNGKKEHARGGEAVWWRCTFLADESDSPLMFEATGLTKGQLYVNNKHVGRYFVATDAGKHVPPQVRYHIPRAWIDEDGPNELVIFDEHGGNPTKCKLVADAGASAFGAGRE
ncbi:MAG: beta galactosidase jelly roll domain-containing protein [Pyrinomonadaceae bacterium]|nr:beta galactosidase jelly roll domain-containing protein [Phycisphaerales bacterium]